METELGPGYQTAWEFFPVALWGISLTVIIPLTICLIAVRITPRLGRTVQGSFERVIMGHEYALVHPRRAARVMELPYGVCLAIVLVTTTVVGSLSALASSNIGVPLAQAMIKQPRTQQAWEFCLWSEYVHGFSMKPETAAALVQHMADQDRYDSYAPFIRDLLTHNDDALFLNTGTDLGLYLAKNELGIWDFAYRTGDSYQKSGFHITFYAWNSDGEVFWGKPTKGNCYQNWRESETPIPEVELPAYLEGVSKGESVVPLREKERIEAQRKAEAEAAKSAGEE